MIYIFLADGFEEIEALTTIDVLRRAELDITMVGLDNIEITGAHNIKVIADIKSDNIETDKITALILPGGMTGTINLQKSKVVNNAIDFCINNNKIIGAICAAPIILGEKGLLKGKNAVCYPGLEEKLIEANIINSQVVVDGNITTAKGAGASMEFALSLVEQLKDKNTVGKLKESMQWKI